MNNLFLIVWKISIAKWWVKYDIVIGSFRTRSNIAARFAIIFDYQNQQIIGLYWEIFSKHCCIIVYLCWLLTRKTSNQCQNNGRFFCRKTISGQKWIYFMSSQRSSVFMAWECVFVNINWFLLICFHLNFFSASRLCPIDQSFNWAP